MRIAMECGFSAGIPTGFSSTAGMARGLKSNRGTFLVKYMSIGDWRRRADCCTERSQTELVRDRISNDKRADGWVLVSDNCFIAVEQWNRRSYDVRAVSVVSPNSTLARYNAALCVVVHGSGTVGHTGMGRKAHWSGGVLFRSWLLACVFRLFTFAD